MVIDFSVMPKYIPMLLNGVKMTILLTLASVGFGVLLGLLTALMKMSRFAVLRSIATTYIEIFRGTPILIQIFLYDNKFLGFPST
jgi:His/Glu/Gln/Arg/opine family amino acid ABC transporter permease subunit